MDGRRRRAGSLRVANKRRDESEKPIKNRLFRVTVEHGLRQLAAARLGLRGEKYERRNAEGRMLELLMGNLVDRATIQHGIASWTKGREEMIGEREIMIDVLLLPEMSRAERAGRA